MKAARFREKHQIQVEELPEKTPQAHEVMVRVRFCGVCGTDVHIYEGDEGAAAVTPPVTLGHEFSGEVASLGAEVKGLQVGDRVAVDPNLYCGKCQYCLNGKRHLCERMIGYGTVKDGGFAEYVTVPEELVYKVADHVSLESAAMLEPISCCLHGMDLTGVELGDTVMVIGTGSIGLIMVQLVKHAGAATIIAVEPDQRRRELARAYGARICIDPLHEDTSAVLRQQGIQCVHKVIDCAGKIDTAEYAIEHAGRGATVMLFGLTKPDETMRLKPFQVFQKELTIKGSFVNPCTFDRARKTLESGIVRVDEILTQVIPLQDIRKVFEERLYAKDGKVLIRC